MNQGFHARTTVGLSLLLCAWPNAATAADSSCRQLLERAERMERASATILQTADELDQARNQARDDAWWGLFGQELNTARHVVDAACSVGERSNPTASYACRGWNTGTLIGDSAVAVQSGDGWEVVALACEAARGQRGGPCRLAATVGQVTHQAVAGEFGQGQAIDSALDISVSGKETVDQLAERGGLGSTGLGGGTAAVASSINAVRSMRASDELAGEAVQRDTDLASLIASIRHRAVLLSQEARELRVRQCVPDDAVEQTVQTEMEAALAEFRATMAGDGAPQSTGLMTSVQQAAGSYADGVARTNQSFDSNVATIRSNGVATAASINAQMSAEMQRAALARSQAASSRAAAAAQNTESSFSQPLQTPARICLRWLRYPNAPLSPGTVRNVENRCLQWSPP